jgi:ABC-type lipoprotein export system ATPase subunit
MALLEVRNVSKLYRTASASVVAVQGVSLEVCRGDFVALVGKSGCGKSTLLNLCGAMDFPSSGEVILDGWVTSDLDDAGLTRLRRDTVGFIFQSFQLLHTLTAVENVELPLLLAKRQHAREQALERLRWVEMDEYAGRYPHQLSGGEQQRIAIARALASNPKLLLADEPTGNLDTATGKMILNLLARTAHEFGVALLMATHSGESAAVVDRVLRMRDGMLESADVLL